MAEGVVSFALEKLWELLSRESARLHGADEQVDELRSELRMLQSLLKDAYAKKYESERVRNFLEDIKDIVYDAEDAIESYLLKEIGGQEKGIKKCVKRLACFLVDRRNFASNIEGITKRISKVIGGMQTLGIQQIIDGGRSLSLEERQREQREIRQTFPNNFESNLVGLEQSVEELVGHLVENDNIQVVSITGMGGIGKTTLARQIFNHDTVRGRFDGFAWVCVSQQFTRKHVWQKIFQGLRPHDENIIHMDEDTLQAKLFHLLETGRYLLVLDDVWTKVDWNRIKAVFPKKRGWKMILTSRKEGVGLHADPTCFTFRPRVLTPEESWKLCEEIVLPRRNGIEFQFDEELETMGKKMVAYCGGLPLAIKVLGGLLAEKQTVEEWKRVSDNIGIQIVGKSGLDDRNPSSVNSVLSLSYEDLPLQLKHCFLYLAHFPEDQEIEVETLHHYWVADGIITLYDGSTIRGSGEAYIEELARRNMVVAEKNHLNSRIEHCRMHDMMREVCISKAREENFLEVVVKEPTSTSIINAQPPSRSRRLAVHSGDASEILGRKNKISFRSLLFFGLHNDFWIQSARGFQSLPLLRVLDLSYMRFEGRKLPSSIGGLIHLRFLSLYGVWVDHLPSSLRNLKLLLYLNLGVISKKSVRVPNVLKEMLELRYLYLPNSMDSTTKLELGDLVKLETLWYFPTEQSSVTDLLRMTKLRDLYVMAYRGCTCEALSSSLRELRHLETLTLMGRFANEVVLDFFHLKELVLDHCMPRLPPHSQMPPNLAYIRLSDCVMEEDPMPILEKLLHLKSVTLTFLAFAGRRMVCSKEGFPQLLELKISQQLEWEEWRVEEGSMPCLRSLTIDGCKELKELPDGLKYIISLKELKMRYMTKEWKAKLTPGGQDYYKIQHIPRVQFIGCDQDDSDHDQDDSDFPLAVVFGV